MDILATQIKERGNIDSYPYSAYLEHVVRWYVHAGDLVSPDQWEELRKVADEACSKYHRSDIIRDARSKVEKAYMMRIVKDNT